MIISELLASLSDLNVKLWVEGDELRYRAPKGVLTPELRAELLEHKADLIALLSTADGVAQSRAPSIQPVARDADLPLSFAQQRFWFLDQLEPGTPIYNIPFAMRLYGPVAVSALHQSLNAIVQRHEALRTTFAARSGRPIQVIHPWITLPLPLIDLRSFPDTTRQAEAKRLAEVALQHSFDLVQGPLLHAGLLRLDDQEHLLLLIVHHIICDGSSMGVIIQEFTAFYTAFVEDRPVALPALPIQYADYAVWQQQWLQGEVLEAQLTHWREQLSGQLPILALPLDHPRPAVQVFRAGLQAITLPGTLSKALEDLSRQEEVTLFMTLLATFQVLLARYSGQNDILIGVPVAGRLHTEIERLIGFFVNTLVLRTDLSGEPTFRELLGRVRAVCLGAYAHQDVPFEKVLEAIQPDRDLSRTPLFQVMFNLLGTSRPAAQPAQLTMTPLEIEESDIDATAQCDLTLTLKDTGQELTASLLYDATLFDATTIERMLRHFQHLLHSIVADPQLPITRLPLLLPAERQLLLDEWSRTGVDYAQPICVHDLFEAQAQATPHKVVAVYEQTAITFQELDIQANRLADLIRSLQR